MFAGAHGWLQGVLSSVLRLVFQNLLQEQEALVAATSRQLWASLLRLVPPAELAAALPCAIIQVLLAPHSNTSLFHHSFVALLFHLYMPAGTQLIDNSVKFSLQTWDPAHWQHTFPRLCRDVLLCRGSWLWVVHRRELPFHSQRCW